ncbi:MAG: trigger factor [Aphanocapsa feldmannii 277cI]|uniref:Trigger factor n=1 Tax=Aphanocapsa feldmannii 277cI TaxID=2507554 RepID=A0A524RSL1_9CHRO|nr:MAG: trigger factor [Aphanocapsa feldmannii 277cI]
MIQLRRDPFPSMATTALQVKASPRPNSRVVLEVEVPGDCSKAAYDATVNKLCRTVKLPGFRKGRVPRPLLIQRATALEDLMEDAVRDAIRRDDLHLIGQPVLKDAFDDLLGRFRPGESLSFSLESDVRPTPRLKRYTGLTARADSVTYDPARLDDLLERRRLRLSTFVPVEDRAAAIDDMVVLKCEAHYSDDGSAIEGGSSDSVEVILIRDKSIPGFVDGVVGMKPGDSRTVECTIPADHGDEEARGRKAVFQLELLELKSRELPTLDDAFARQCSDQETLAALRQELEQQLKDEAEQGTIDQRHEALLEALTAELEVEIPEVMVRQEFSRMLQETVAELGPQDMDLRKVLTDEKVEHLFETGRPEAVEQLRHRLALQALITAEGISVDDDDVEEKVRQALETFTGSGDVDMEKLRERVREDMLNAKALTWLDENNSVQMSDAALENPSAEAPPAMAAAAEAPQVSAETAPHDSSDDQDSTR